MDWLVCWRWPQEFDCVFSGNGAGRMIETIALHQMKCGSPVAMAIEHRTGDAAAQHSRKCFLVTFRLPVSDHFVAGREAANVEALFVCRATAETPEVGRVSFLDAFHKQLSKVQSPMS